MAIFEERKGAQSRCEWGIGARDAVCACLCDRIVAWRGLGEVVRWLCVCAWLAARATVSRLSV